MPRRAGFTLMESLLALSILAVSSSVMLLAVETGLGSAGNAVEQAQADGLARQVIDEILSTRYMAAGGSPYQYPMGPNSWEASGNGRERFNDTDDFQNFSAQPAEDRWGQQVGTGNGAGGLRHANFRLPAGSFSNWRQEIRLAYVNSANLAQDLTGSQTSDYRSITVSIFRVHADGTLRLVTQVRRVFAYVPPPA